ncbi:mRNA cleavage and polyadenylation factor subunit [Yamadazyma tenuis]|uniref:Protein CFT1 n=1 Tax=Candida tenuis (strain ATCC 10573 / BCRC 21748 / CBS 615 / JCM 9827 / NBRC 10315 / NRRL Y-1498 / VKM Y-70) TaxID=590646 RepID=G3BAZ0_CANTC|nr:uncharacterized protein CANTEDRAFT_109087 [Yamadazyma tenuis ATCC 10573]EGV61485.1 hypothetical protein CANTEDRAFT_109087 [Yamadazyma tenuis ATCC 10573]WEJ92701.1 mRNA cleavage and polyadenylation factor subunit [Yamadazyma tenuis]
MEAYNEFIEPTRVSHCVGAHFISPSRKHVIVAKTSVLQVFEVLRVKKSFRLNLVDQYKLFGTITSIKPIRTIENPKLDYLLVATQLAKISLVRWDHASHSIRTVSLHYYENVIQTSTFDKLNSAELIVEPKNACLCVRYKNLLTFLPFTRLKTEEDEYADEEDGAVTNSYDGIYDSSFLINGQNLDSRIGTIVDADFLHNYRQPTVALLSSKDQVWAGNLFFKKDNISYIVLSLDLNTKKSTTVLKIDDLPYDIDRLISLPSPLNGSLLVGANQLIHIDNGGITRKISVNPFTDLTTKNSKNYINYSHMNLRLENCSVVPLPNENKVLVILSTGEFYMLTFEIDGKTIKRLTFEVVETSRYNGINVTFPGQFAALDNNLLFVGNKNGNSPLIQYKYEGAKEKAVKEDAKDEEDNDGDEELYEDDEEKVKSFSKEKLDFTLCDELINHGPISAFTFGFYSNEKFKSNLINPNYQEVSIFSNSGSHKQSHLNIFTPSIQPTIKSSLTFSTINKLWISNNFLITSDDKNRKSEIFQVNNNFARVKSKDFINKNLTIAIHELNNGKFILQVTPKKILLYDNKFKKKMALNKVLDKEKEEEVFNSYCTDEILMLFLTNGDVKIIAINTYNETFTEISIPKILSDTIITTGYVTNSNILNAVSKDVNLLIKNKKRKFSNLAGDSISKESEESLGPKQKVFILVTGDNRIVLFNRSHNERCYQLNDIDKFTDHLHLGFFENKDSYPDPFIKQVMFNEIGNEISKSQYLTVLTIGGEVILYKLFFDGENFRFLKEENLLITGAPHSSFNVTTKVERQLFHIENLSGLTGIFVSGDVPYYIVKTNHSIPRIFKFARIPIMSFGKFANNQLIFLDDKKNTRICEIPSEFNYENNWPARQINIGETIKDVAYHETSNTFVISTYKEIPYNCLDEENVPIVGIMEDKPSALSYKGSIKLVSPISWTVIDEFELDDNEVGTKVSSMVLDVGSSTRRFKSKREFVVIGTGKLRMEDLAANGSFKVLEIIDVIPEPGHPETNHKFKEFYKEETKGAVTAVSDVSGRFLVSQGQKIIVRDLQDDGVVPVAFLDCSVYVSESKSYGNFVLLGDTLKSVWLAGFDAEPYRMIMLGKDLKSIDVNCADFIVKDEELYIIVGDNNNILHLLKYDPEDPNSSNGQRLVEKAAFNLNAKVTQLKQLPNLMDNSTSCIGSTIEGSFFTVFPINESSYRRMYILQQQLTDKAYHHCGLNPRLNRFGGLKLTANESNNKPILDYDVIKLYAKLNEDRRRNIGAKVSREGSEIWRDMLEFEAGVKM